MTRAIIDAIRTLRIELVLTNDGVAAAAGLLPRELDVLDIIDRDGPCTPRYLSRRTGVPAATLTGVLARLERDAWIRRSADPADRRSAQLSSTERFDELRALYGGVDAEVHALTATLDQEAASTVTAFLDQLASTARDRREGLIPQDGHLPGSRSDP